MTDGPGWPSFVDKARQRPARHLQISKFGRQTLKLKPAGAHTQATGTQTSVTYSSVFWVSAGPTR